MKTYTLGTNFRKTSFLLYKVFQKEYAKIIMQYVKNEKP